MNERIWPNRTTAQEAASYRASGLWRGRSMAQSLEIRLTENPQAIAVVDDVGRYTYAELDAKARRLAGWLLSWGIKRGDVVAFQLPNWHETAVIALATSLLGLVCLPIVPIYREAELRAILSASGARLLFSPRVFRGFDHATVAAKLVDELPELEAVCLLRDPQSTNPFAAPPYTGPALGKADDPWLLMYTSGTTGHPKGVVHPANTLDCELGHVTSWWDLKPDRDVTLMASPVTHVTGFLYGVLMPISHGIRSVLMERWDARHAIDLIAGECASFAVSATLFLRELLDAAETSGDALATLRVFACGGAPVPPDLIRRAWQKFPKLLACRVYGSTEAPTVSLGVASRDELTLAAETDGRIVGHEVRIAGGDGRILPPGSEGEILTRGPEMFSGYLDPADNVAAFDDDGFFLTGDLGYVTLKGCIVITGRKKDLIIRGGENLSAKEIEDALHRHPAIRETAVVAMPHDRLGETCCAFVITGGVALNVSAVSAFLTAEGLARQKHPERLVLVDNLPRTASGKVQKYLLRKQLWEGAH